MDTKETTVGFRLPHDIRSELARVVPPERNGPGPAAEAVVAWARRYLEMTRRHPPEAWLSAAELAVVAEVMNGVLTMSDHESQAAALALLWGGVADYLHSNPGLPRSVAVQAEALVRKLQAAPYADLLGLVHWVDQYWAGDPIAAVKIQGVTGAR